MSTLKVTNLQHDSAASANIVLDSSNNVTTANNLTAGGTIGCTGNLTVTSGNVVLSSGNGIDFSATANSSGTMTSELLDDYEEGTWTPVYNTSDSNMTGTFNGNGAYTKIGNTVHVYIRFQVSAITAAGTGILRITGLPFGAASGATWGGVVPLYCGNFSTTATPASGRIDGGAAYIDLFKRNGSDARSNLTTTVAAADLAANNFFDAFYACYRV